MDPRYSRYYDICGLTEKEIRDNLSEEVDALADNLGVQAEEAYAILRENYDGYHFSEDNVPGLYTPFKNDKLEIICIGVNYSGKGRNIDKWLVNYL